MGGLANNAFRNITAIPRKTSVLPGNITTPQKAIDVARGKIEPSRGALLSKPLEEQGRIRRPIGTLFGRGALKDSEEKKKARGSTLLT